MKKSVILLVVGLIAGLLLGWGLTRRSGSDEMSVTSEDGEKQVTMWTCSMHPQVRQPETGQCPICGMDLIPVANDTGGDELGPRELKLSPTAQKLASVRTAAVERRVVERTIRMVGKVEYDETRLGYITAWVGGRIDRLFVDFTGTPVMKGDPMVDLYSPELIAAQEELIQSAQMVEEMGQGATPAVARRAQTTLESAREKLRLLGLMPDQIEEIEKEGEPSENLTIQAPMSGIVIHKNALEGKYVSTGNKIYTIADLSVVWVKLDAYESDLSWLAYGQEVEFTTEAMPGRTFTGTVAFIDPVLNPKTRTVKVRVNVSNEDGALKPEMFVRARVKAQLGAEGRLLRGPSAESAAGALVIPASAPLITGKRAVVYVADPEREGIYGGREITLGPRADDYYVVLEGLEEGEQVVKNGAFKIDSAIQIQAKPSMMNPEGGGTPPGHDHGGSQGMEMQAGPSGTQTFDSPDALRKALDGFLESYFKVQTALKNDSLSDAKAGVGAVVSAVASVDMKSLPSEQAHVQWKKHIGDLRKESEALSSASDLEEARLAFDGLSRTAIALVQQFGASGEQSVYQLHCPMAFNNKGADWLQSSAEVQNPYFGSIMLRCGEVTRQLVKEDAPEGHEHE